MWEKIKEEAKVDEHVNTHVYSHRIKVSGGWIVRSICTRESSTSISQLFVTDIAHQWKL